MKQNKLINGVFSIFAIIGTILFIVGILCFVSAINTNDKVETTGTITQIYRYGVMVSYDVDGETYEAMLNESSSSFHKGKELKIYYYKDNPTTIRSYIGNMLILILPGIGLVFMLIGGIGLFVKITRKNKIKELKEKGNVVIAKYTNLEQNTSIYVNGRRPFNVICEWVNPTDGITYIFRSENIWRMPQKTIEEKNITTFPVYINPNKISEYYVDISALNDNVVDLT